MYSTHSTHYLINFISVTTRPPPNSTLFPYTTLFRSRIFLACGTEDRFYAQMVALREKFTQLGIPATWSSGRGGQDRKSTRLNSSHPSISYAVFCLKKKKIYIELLLFRYTHYVVS